MDGPDKAIVDLHRDLLAEATSERIYEQAIQAAENVYDASLRVAEDAYLASLGSRRGPEGSPAYSRHQNSVDRLGVTVFPSRAERALATWHARQGWNRAIAVTTE